MVNLNAIVELSHVEHTALALRGFLFELADGNEGRELKLSSYLSGEVVHALGELEDEVRTHETFTKDHDRVTIKLHAVTELENVVWNTLMISSVKWLEYLSALSREPFSLLSWV